MVFRYGTKSTPWIACGTAAPGHVSLLVDLNYQVFPTINGIRQESGPLVQLYGGGSEHCSMAPESGEYALIPIPNQVLENALRGLGIERMPVEAGRFTALQPENETFRMLLDTIESLRAGAETSPEMFLSGEVRRTAERELLTRLALVIGASEPSHGMDHRIDRMKVFRKARAFLHERSHTPVYLAELCAATGVPERTLRDIFQSVLGVSPLKYLQLRRMRQVRQALQQVGQTGSQRQTNRASQRLLGTREIRGGIQALVRRVPFGNAQLGELLKQRICGHVNAYRWRIEG